MQRIDVMVFYKIYGECLDGETYRDFEHFLAMIIRWVADA